MSNPILEKESIHSLDRMCGRDAGWRFDPEGNLRGLELPIVPPKQTNKNRRTRRRSQKTADALNGFILRGSAYSAVAFLCGTLRFSAPLRGYIQPALLKELWFHTGTGCNLRCSFCLEGSKPGDNRLNPLTLKDAKPFIEATANWRSKKRNLPLGDQGFFLRRKTFDAVGGFPDQPIMEDYAFARTLRHHGKIITVSQPAITSGRRWQQHGRH